MEQHPATTTGRAPTVPLANLPEVDANRSAAEQVRVGAERLGQVAAHMEKFLAEQCQAIEQQLHGHDDRGEDDAVEKAAEFARLQADFETIRKKWEHERAEERDRLMDESQRLVTAWKELENEQREMLKLRVLKPNTQPAVGNTPTDELSPTTKEVQRAAEPNEATPAADSKMPTSRQGPAQFQQLRREMLEHARQRRKR